MFIYEYVLYVYQIAYSLKSSSDLVKQVKEVISDNNIEKYKGCICKKFGNQDEEGNAIYNKIGQNISEEDETKESSCCERHYQEAHI